MHKTTKRPSIEIIRTGDRVWVAEYDGEVISISPCTEFVLVQCRDGSVRWVKTSMISKK